MMKMNNLKPYPNQSLFESLGSPTDTFVVELDKSMLDLDILGDPFIDKDGKLKFADKEGGIIKDLKKLGFDEEYDLDIDTWSSTLRLEYYWDIDVRKYGIKEMEFIPVRARLDLVVNKVYDDRTEELDIEIEFDNFNEYKTELAFPVSEVYVELSCGGKYGNATNSAVEDQINWKWVFAIGNTD